MKGWLAMGKKNSTTLPQKIGTLKKKGVVLPGKSGKVLPDFDSMLDPRGLPGLPDMPDMDAEATVNQETDDMMQMLRENRRNNAERFRDIEAGEFWFCVCFQSRSQKEDFLRLLLERYSPSTPVEKFGDKYVSGLELAEMLGVGIEPMVLEVKKSRLAPKGLRGREVIS